MIELISLQDLAISLGSLIGLITKIYALTDKQTVWTRKSSLTNILFYPPSLWAFFSLELYLTFLATSTSFFTWIGIYLFRSPKNEDLLGRELH